MKIETSVLTHFLNRCAVKTHGFGNRSVTAMPDLLLVAEGDQLKVEGVSPAGNLQIEFVETLSESVDREEFPIVDTALFHKIVSSEMDGEINMHMDGSLIILESEKTKVTFPTVEEIETMKRYPEARDKIRDNGYGRVDFGTTVKITTTELASAIGNSGSTYNLYVYKFDIKDGVFTISIKTDDKGSVIKKPISSVTGVDCSAKYATGIDTIFKGMVGEVKLQFNQDTPMMVTDEVGNKSVFMPLDN